MTDPAVSPADQAWTVPLAERFFDLSVDLLYIADPVHFLKVNPAFQRTLGYSDRELLSRPLLDFIHPGDRIDMNKLHRELENASEPERFSNRFLCSDGSRRWIEWNVVSHRGLCYAAGRDLTERLAERDWTSEAQCMVRESHIRLRTLAGQQEALRRVAILVARGVSSPQVFAAVAEEMARCLHVCQATLFRYEPDDSAVVVGSFDEMGVQHIPVGERMTLEGDNVTATVWHSRRATRIDNYENASGPAAARMRELGLRTGVGAPITVNGRLWGVAVVDSALPNPLPPDTEARMSDFADLVATAIANAATRSELIASRARIVSAADDARRRLERDLHDGAQQRLVSLGMQLRMAEAGLPSELQALKNELSELLSGLHGVVDDLRTTSRGIHPAILSEGGLDPAVKTLARRSAVPVALDLATKRRLPDSAEIAAYYVVAEALTNAAKHAHASEVKVSTRVDEENLNVLVHDNGIGGANSAKGSGLVGLIDRVEALGGHLQVMSPPGSGTSLEVSIPLHTT